MAIDVESLYDRRADDRWNRTSVGDVLERLTYSRPDRVAITGWAGAFGDPAFERLTYREAAAVVERVANGLLAAGLQRGDRVLLVCENSVEAYLTKLGAARAGLVSVPLNPSLAPDVVAQLVELAQPRFAVVDAELWEHVRPAFADQGLRVDVTIPIGGGPVEGSVAFADFVAAQTTEDAGATVHGDDIWEILFTSGTTALPKGVMLSHHYAHFGAYSFALSMTRGLAVEADLVQVAFLPVIYHVADQCLSLSAFLSGGRLVLGRRPVPAEMAAAVQQESGTCIWGGSPQLVKAFAAALAAEVGDGPRSPLRVVVYGWGAVEAGVRSSLRASCGDDLTLMGIFGQTEAISCHRFWPATEEAKVAAAGTSLNYVGIPNPLLSSIVMDVDGSSLMEQPGVPGEAVYRSPAVTAGYYRDRAATEEAFRYGWFHSGDSCVVDEDGLRIMVDRYKDIIKSGGENVSSLRVEALLHEHPQVTKAAVVGLRHDRWGEAVTAVVVRAPGATVTERELVDWCRERLAGFETPKAVLFSDALPETVGGKVLKYKLRQAMADLYDDTAADLAPTPR
ncbi:Acyl-CoA synthetase (AMP-forming)/AMP-acid ligase II [Klenkia soli]|uniref:Acyl-CoA synthetase (AMP-forming)/AMP-acid ligase II n=1 Tax=Klenkia soli TaxID=1052260 RepID=A0A1H0PEL3_9ACTN|nr:AMP-binding protein [Klenkia soli]SDP03547.1 Acyl-CoA synthetase (AMP-forming)/AMP-acid ligase II [Klenkia soli]